MVAYDSYISPEMRDGSLCHHCHKNKLDPDDSHFLPNHVQVCRDCAAKISTARAERASQRIARRAEIAKQLEQRTSVKITAKKKKR